MSDAILVPVNTAGSETPYTSSVPLKKTISALPGTDLWRKPPSLDIYNAPAYVLNIRASSFRRARVTVSANWERLYDQGGLVLFLPAWPKRTAWVKTGIEHYDGKPHFSVVAAREAADWSLRAGTQSVTLEIEREEVDKAAGTGSSLWVYIVEGDVRTAVREVTWVFADDKDLAGMLSIGIYAARPTRDSGGDQDSKELSVNFRDFFVEYDA